MSIEEKHQRIIETLYDTWSNDQGLRKEAENILNEFEKDETFVVYLLCICSYSSVHYTIRKLSITYSKNLITRYWNSRGEIHFSEHIKKQVKEKIIEILNNVENLKNCKEFGNLLVKISRYELVNKFPELLECLLHNVNLYKGNLKYLYSYLYLLYKIIREQCSKKLVKDKKETYEISERVISTLDFLWNNEVNLYFKNETEFCVCNDESNCETCSKLQSLITEYEEKLFVSEKTIDSFSTSHTSQNPLNKFPTNSTSGTSRPNIQNTTTSNDMNNTECENGYEPREWNKPNEIRIKILKFLDSILINLIINRNDVNKGITNCSTDLSNNSSNNNNNIERSVVNADANIRGVFFNALINKTIYHLKFLHKNSALYYLNYLKFLLTNFLLMIEFHSSFHNYLKRETTEKFICLFLKKNLNINSYDTSYDNKFAEIVNICISIIKSIFYHFCLYQYNLVKQKRVRENYNNVKTIMYNKEEMKQFNNNSNNSNQNTIELKIINNLIINAKQTEHGLTNIHNASITLKEILSYIREEVKQALSNDEYILLHNQKALEVFDFLRIYCINITTEQIIENMLNIKDDFEIDENIFYNNAKDCIVQLAVEPFLLPIFNHFFEPLINAFHTYAHTLNNFPQQLKHIQAPEYSEAIIQLDGYLNIYSILFASFHKRIKPEHILYMIQFFVEFLSIKHTHPLITYRIAMIIKVWIKTHKMNFPYIEQIIILIYENIRCLYIQLLQNNEVSIIPDKFLLGLDLTFQHYGLKASNFLPILYFNFICLFKYVFKYDYVFQNYDYINEFLIGSLINVLTMISYPKKTQQVLKILSYIVFMSNQEKDISIFKDNYAFLLNLYKNSNLSIREYILQIMTQILKKDFENFSTISESMKKDFMKKEGFMQGLERSGSSCSNSSSSDNLILFNFSFDIIAYTLRANVEHNMCPLEQRNVILELQVKEELGKNINTSSMNPLNPLHNVNYLRINEIDKQLREKILENTIDKFYFIKEINLDIDKTLDDNFYSLWICVLKLISKEMNTHNRDIIKKMCSLYIPTIRYLREYFNKVRQRVEIYEIHNGCFEVVMEYICLLFMFERHNEYLTLESASTRILTNHILNKDILSIIENNFICNDETKIEKCMYMLHICIGIFEEDLKIDRPILYTYMANFIVIYLIEILTKYFNKYFNFYKYFYHCQGIKVISDEIILHNDHHTNNNSDCNNNSNTFIINNNNNETFGNRNKVVNGTNDPDDIFMNLRNEANHSFNSSNACNGTDAELTSIMSSCNKYQVKYIYDNIMNGKHHDNDIVNKLNIFQQDVKRLLNIHYLNDFSIMKTFEIYNFFTVQQDTYQYVNKYTMLPLISILSLYDHNFINYIIISFFCYFKINASLLILSFIYQSQYIHNQNLSMSLLLIVYLLMQAFVFNDFSINLPLSNFPNIPDENCLRELISDKNKIENLFSVNEEDKIILCIEFLKMINNILHTNKDIYIEKKNILHLSTSSASITGSRIFQSYNYNYVCGNILKCTDISAVCSTVLENLLTYVKVTKVSEKNNKKRLVMKYLKENLEDMHGDVVKIFKKHTHYS